MLSNLPSLKDDEEDVSYNAYSLLTNMLLKDTIEHIIKQVYAHQKLKFICSKLNFKYLLLKLATECTYTFNRKFYKQIGGCTISICIYIYDQNGQCDCCSSKTSILMPLC